MKYGISYLIVGLVFGSLAVAFHGWCLLLLWPAVSFCLAGLAYLWFGPRLFGKRTDGSQFWLCRMILLPFLLCSWIQWHVIRWIIRVSAWNQVMDHLTIGRRLVASEFPDTFDVVVDLTCEFAEQPAIVRSCDYCSFPILDGSNPSAESLARLVDELSSRPGHIYIHCAQGHGRTGLVAAALLLQLGIANDPISAVRVLQAKRRRVRLARRQAKCLDATWGLIQVRAKQLAASG